MDFVRAVASHLPHSSKSGAKRRVRAGAIFDPRGQFGERRRSSVTSVTQDHGGIVATVTDSSSFGQMKSNICELFCLPPSEWIIAVNVFFFLFISVMNIASLPIDWLTAFMQRFSISAWPGLLPPPWGYKGNKTKLCWDRRWASFQYSCGFEFGIMFIPHLGFAGARGDHIWMRESGAGEIILIWLRTRRQLAIHKKVATPEAYLVSFTWNGTIIY